MPWSKHKNMCLVIAGKFSSPPLSLILDLPVLLEGSQPTPMLVIQQVFLLWFQTCQTNFVIAEMPRGRLQTMQHMSSLHHQTDTMEPAQNHVPCDCGQGLICTPLAHPGSPNNV